MDLELDGRVVMITGGSDGLGAALAARLVTEGASVAICGRSQERLDGMVERLTADGGDVLGVRADVTVPADIEVFVAAVTGRWGRLDALVNNAGVSAAAPFSAISDHDWEADLELKLMAAIRTTRAAMPLLEAAAGASIVNVLASAAKAPPGSSMPSSVSRAAGMAFTKALSKDLGAAGIRANAVLVGIVESDQWVRRAAELDMPLEDLHDELARATRVPLGRIGRAEEFADLVAFLVSARAGYVNGAAINLDGGSSPVV